MSAINDFYRYIYSDEYPNNIAHLYGQVPLQQPGLKGINHI